MASARGGCNLLPQPHMGNAAGSVQPTRGWPRRLACAGQSTRTSTNPRTQCPACSTRHTPYTGRGCVCGGERGAATRSGNARGKPACTRAATSARAVASTDINHPIARGATGHQRKSPPPCPTPLQIPGWHLMRHGARAAQTLAGAVCHAHNARSDPRTQCGFAARGHRGKAQPSTRRIMRASGCIALWRANNSGCPWRPPTTTGIARS